MKQFLIAGFAFSMLAGAASAAYVVGDVPSDFTCTDWDGNTWNLYEQRGKVVLINFGATW
jgi:cytochrome oxidase Cu insertion factor (SCO1/SenC/PrrC family)